MDYAMDTMRAIIMPRTSGAKNIRPSQAETAKLISTLKANAADGDSLAALGLLLFAQSPYARKDRRYENDSPRV